MIPSRPIQNPQAAAPQIPLTPGIFSNAKTPRPQPLNRSQRPIRNPKKMNFAKQSEPNLRQIPSPTAANLTKPTPNFEPHQPSWYTIFLCQRSPPPGIIIPTIGRSVCGGSWLNSVLQVKRKDARRSTGGLF